MSFELYTKVISVRELKSCFIRECIDDLLIYDVKFQHEVTLEDIMEMVETAGIIGGGKKFKILIIAGEYSSISNDATMFMKSEEAHRFTYKEAIVINSLAQRILGNFYMGIVQKKRPTTIFNSTEKAIAWLNS